LRFSVLDSAPVRDGGTSAEALTDALARAGQLDRLGFHRLWFTEHHLASDVASSSPLTLIGQSLHHTSRLRLGAGGVMIRNHAPLVVAEQVVTLSLLHPGRIDLGLGRSGGSEPATDAKLRRTIVEYGGFEDDVAEILYYLEQLQAGDVETFILASSGNTARFAGRHGLGLAVAGHIAPAGMDEAIASYRTAFRPGPACARPQVVLCLPILIADSDEEALWWFRSVQQRYLDRLRTGGAPMRPPADADLDWSASERYRVDAMLEAALVGSVPSVFAQLRDISSRWSPDDVMAMSDLPDTAMTMSSHVRLADVTSAIETPLSR
jgi:luciferase family oxidoreductase group 1